MIGIGVPGSRKGLYKVLAKYGDSELETAVEMAKSIAEHSKGEVVVFLSANDKYYSNFRILKRVKVAFVLQMPTLRHPFRYPGRRMTVR
jgi:gamma-glutamyltranspeptidase